MERNIRISDYDYPLPEGRIAKFPLERREQSKLLVCRDGRIAEDRFERIGRFLPEGSMLVFNNTKVIRARLIFHKATGARIEIFCLEPHAPADYERAFAAHGRCRWQCIVGNLKKWKDGPLQIAFGLGGRTYRLEATRTGDGGGHQIVEFVWDAPLAFGQLLEELGRIPIPPYLCRESEELDNSRYQTVYSRFEGSVAAPTAGLHFTPEVIGRLRAEGHPTAEVTLHVGAGTFLPVKAGNAAEHPMHTEHFEITLDALQGILEHIDRITAVGTTSMRTLESARGARLPGSARRNARRAQECRPMGNLRHARADRRARVARGVGRVHGTRPAAKAESLDADHDRTGLSLPRRKQPDHELSPTAEHAAVARIGIHRRTVERSLRLCARP